MGGDAHGTHGQDARATWGAPWGKPAQKYFEYCSYGLNGYITDENIDIEFKRRSEVIAFQNHIEQ